MTTLETILQDIIGKYGSLENPNFSFVSKAIAEGKYAPLIRAIKDMFDVEEDTDPNEDVSFGLIMRSGGKELVLRLSMVAHYAVMLRASGDAFYEVVDPSKIISEDEQSIVELLRKHGVDLLDRSILMEHVPLAMSNTPIEDCCVYQALFTDVDVLPWR